MVLRVAEFQAPLVARPARAAQWPTVLRLPNCWMQRHPPERQEPAPRRPEDLVPSC